MFFFFSNGCMLDCMIKTSIPSHSNPLNVSLAAHQLSFKHVPKRMLIHLLFLFFIFL